MTSTDANTPNDTSVMNGAFTPAEILEQLDRLVQSSHFRNSRRYPTLLRYIVETTVAGEEGSLKERTLGVEVFGRSPDYDTNADPVVRVTAGEIRKRIAQYYQAPGHETEIRFDLPLGSYVPQFSRSNLFAQGQGAFGQEAGRSTDSDPSRPAFLTVLPAVEESTPSQRRRDRIIFARRATPGMRLTAILALLVLVGGAIWTVVAARQRQQQESEGTAFFWGPVLGSQEPALVVLGMSALESPLSAAPSADNPQTPQDQDNSAPPVGRTDMVPVEDVISYGRLVSLLSQHDHAYSTQAAADTSFDQLRHGPLLLIGGYNNIWVLRLTANLRFRFSTDSSGTQVIQDSEHPGTVWQRDIAPDALSYRDYAVVGCFFDPRIERYVLFASGIGRSGTAAASEFLTNEKYLREWVARTHPDRRHNVEIVLSTEIIDGKHGPPHVLASQVW